jgi:hypothetical protein
MVARVHPCTVWVALAVQLLLAVPTVRGQIDIANLDANATDYARRVGAFRPTVDTSSMPVNNGGLNLYSFVHCPINGKLCEWSHAVPL